jgi:indole-3-glycerol phosphate synthase
VPDVLTELVEASAARAARVDRGRLRELLAEAPPARPFPPGFLLIAEIKPRSPRDGALGEPDAARRARQAVDAGAGAVSVLTEPTRFGGSLELLREAAQAVPAPVLRKDFVVDEVQVDEARALGASAVLLIARVLRERLPSFVSRARALGLWPLVEVFAEADLGWIEGLDARIAVNARDLATLAVDRGRFARLAPRLPGAVAASGMETAEDIARVARLGYRGALVGSALMRAREPRELIAALVAAGRESCT